MFKLETMVKKRLEDEDFCYVTTTGRVTGISRQIEIWFAMHNRTLYLLSGGRDRSNWVRNIQRQPAVSVRIGAKRFTATARIVTDADEDALARRLVLDKYRPRDSSDLTEWGETSLPVAIDLEEDL